MLNETSHGEIRCMLLRFRLPHPLLQRRFHASPLPVDNVRITTLPNKIRVATEITPSHFTTLGAYVDAGPRYEVHEQLGASHFLERLAFKSSKATSAESMTAIADKLGGQLLCASSREAVIYQISHFSGGARSAMNLLAETILSPAFIHQELEMVRESSRYELREWRTKPELFLPEMLHRVAYGSTGLGNPILCPETSLDVVNEYTLRAFMQDWYRPERLVIAGAGIDHEELISLTEEFFSTMNSRSDNPKPCVNRYVGGYHHSLGDPDAELGHIYIGFKGLPISDPSIYALAVIQFLLGGGGSFSAGGPGKGMYSRFYTNILNQHPEIDHCSAFHHIYAESSLFGIFSSFYHTTQFRKTPMQVLPYLLEQLRLLLFTPTTKQELERAKNQLKSSLMMALESQATEVEDLGRQVRNIFSPRRWVGMANVLKILVHGRRIPVMDMCYEIDKVTSEDIMHVAHSIFGKGCSDPVSLVIQGPVGADCYKQLLKEQGIGGH